MDIEDPFSISEEFWVNNFKIYRRKNFRAEQKALEQADAVSVTVEAAKRAYENAFENIINKIIIVPPVVNVVQAVSTIQFNNFEKDKIHIAYFGTFYERVRMPNVFLELLQQLLEDFPDLKNRIQVHFLELFQPKLG